MPYFSTTNKYRAPGSADPSLRSMLNSLPLGTILCRIDTTGAQNIAVSTLATPQNINFGVAVEDTGNFIPKLFPVKTITIPPQAGGLYIWTYIMEWAVAISGAGVMTFTEKGPGPWPAIDMVTNFAALNLTMSGFKYLRPGDVIDPRIHTGGGGAPKSLGYASLRIARVTV